MVSGIITSKQSITLKGFVAQENREYIAIPTGHLKKKGKIIAGDYFKGVIIDSERVNILSIEPRVNSFIRPPVANIKQVIISSCYKEPEFTRLNLDKLLTVYAFYNAEPIVLFNKIDLLSDKEFDNLKKIAQDYSQCGFSVVLCSAETKEGIDDAVKIITQPGVTILAGESGTGKTTLINAITGTDLITNEISHKTLRGRQTTISTNLIKIADNSFIGDSPGFSEIDPALFMTAEEFRDAFRGFEDYECKFDNCMHINEPGCSIREKYTTPESPGNSRYESYKSIMETLIAIPKWQHKKRGKL